MTWSARSENLNQRLQSPNFLQSILEDFPGRPVRTPKRHPWTSPKPSEDGLCIECKGRLRGRRAYFCGVPCDEAWHLRHSWVALRNHIRKRDAYRCVRCRSEHRKLEVDHIVALMDGGAEFDPANLQTLCRPCHVAKTATDWKVRKAHGRLEVGGRQGELQMIIPDSQNFLQGG